MYMDAALDPSLRSSIYASPYLHTSPSYHVTKYLPPSNTTKTEPVAAFLPCQASPVWPLVRYSRHPPSRSPPSPMPHIFFAPSPFAAPFTPLILYLILVHDLPFPQASCPRSPSIRRRLSRSHPALYSWLYLWGPPPHQRSALIYCRIGSDHSSRSTRAWERGTWTKAALPSYTQGYPPATLQGTSRGSSLYVPMSSPVISCPYMSFLPAPQPADSAQRRHGAARHGCLIPNIPRPFFSVSTRFRDSLNHLLPPCFISRSTTILNLSAPALFPLGLIR